MIILEQKTLYVLMGHVLIKISVCGNSRDAAVLGVSGPQGNLFELTKNLFLHIDHYLSKGPLTS